MVNIEDGFSIVICTYNGADKVEETLRHISRLDIPQGYKFEVIIVDNGSNDGTREVCEALWTTLGRPHDLILIEDNRIGKGFAVETGYDAAAFSFILTVDDDNWLQHDYLVEAANLLNQNQDIGALQAKIEGVFQSEPPRWFNEYQNYFIIGSVVEKVGFLESDNCWIWGAGMVIRNRDWRRLRSLGFQFLTSKVAGKAAGEDNELAIALLMLGRKFYYSDKLRLRHFMPTQRLKRAKLMQNFKVFGHVSYYLFLYKLVYFQITSKKKLNSWDVYIKFLKHWLAIMNSFSLKQHYNYFKSPETSLILVQYYEMGVSFNHHKNNVRQDIKVLNQWMKPLLTEQPNIIFPL